MGSVKKHRRVESCMDNLYFDTLEGTYSASFCETPYGPISSSYDNNSVFKLDLNNMFKEPEVFYVRIERDDFLGPEKM